MAEDLETFLRQGWHALRDPDPDGPIRALADNAPEERKRQWPWSILAVLSFGAIIPTSIFSTHFGAALSVVVLFEAVIGIISITRAGLPLSEVKEVWNLARGARGDIIDAKAGDSDTK